MASVKHWLNVEGALVDIAEVAPSPSKDFFHIFVTQDLVIHIMYLNSLVISQNDYK